MVRPNHCALLLWLGSRALVTGQEKRLLGLSRPRTNCSALRPHRTRGTKTTTQNQKHVFPSKIERFFDKTINLIGMASNLLATASNQMVSSAPCGCPLATTGSRRCNSCYGIDHLRVPGHGDERLDEIRLYQRSAGVTPVACSFLVF